MLPGLSSSIFSHTFTTIHRHTFVKKTKAGREVKWPCPEEDPASAAASPCLCWYVRLCVARAMPRATPFFPHVLSSLPHIFDRDESLVVRMRSLVLLPSHRHPRPLSFLFPHPPPLQFTGRRRLLALRSRLCPSSRQAHLPTFIFQPC